MKKIGILLLSIISFSECNLVMSMIETKQAEPQIRISPENKNFLVAQRFNLNAFYLNSENEEIDITNKASWWISDPHLANLTSTGILHTKNPGSVRISVSYDGYSRELDYNFITPEQLWLTFYGGSGAVSAKSMICTDDGGYLILGEASSDVIFKEDRKPKNRYQGACDYFILKIKNNGDYVWHTFFGGNSIDSPSAVIESNEGDFLILGSSNSNIKTQGRAYVDGEDMLLVKLASDGVLKWFSYFGSQGDDIGTSLAELSTGEIIIAGTSNFLWDRETYIGNNDIVIARIDSDGINIKWNQFFGSPKNDKSVKILVGNEDTIYCCSELSGTFEVAKAFFNGQKDYYIRCMNADGDLRWDSFFGSQVDDIPQDMILTENALIVVGNSTKSMESSINPYSKRSKDILAVSLSRDNGEVLWSTFQGGVSDDVAAAVVETPDKGIVIVGSSFVGFGKPLNPHSGYDNDIFLFKLDPSGALKWHTYYGGKGIEIPMGLAVASNEGIVVTGTSSASFGEPKNSFIDGGDNLFAVHFLKNGVCPTIDP